MIIILYHIHMHNFNLIYKSLALNIGTDLMQSGHGERGCEIQSGGQKIMVVMVS